MCRNLSLLKAAAGRLQSKRRKRAQEVEIYPNVFDSKATVIQTAAFVGGVRVRSLQKDSRNTLACLLL